MSLIKEFEKEEEDHSIEENTEEEEDKLTIIVSGLKSTTAKDTVLFYFENSRRSGGGEVINVDFNEQGDAVVTFQEVKGTYFEITLINNIQGFLSRASSISVTEIARRSAQVILKYSRTCIKRSPSGNG